MMKKLLFVISAAFCVLLVACSKDNEQDLLNAGGGGGTTPTCDTVNMRYSANVVPILTANCYSCHGNGRTMGGVNLDTYTNVKAQVNSTSLLGTITHASGYSPMPKNAAKLSACDINKIISWINRGALNN